MESQRGLEHLDRVWEAKEVWSTWIEYGKPKRLEHLDKSMGSQRGLEHLDRVWEAKEVWSTWIEYGSQRGLEHLDRVWKANTKCMSLCT